MDEDKLIAQLQADLRTHGCLDGNCTVSRPVGMHTNGGCRCHHDRHKMLKVMWIYEKFLKALIAGRSKHDQAGPAERVVRGGAD